MSATWFTSDHHFGHAKIMEWVPTRKFADVTEMNEAMIDGWNSVVAPSDEVWHLGDVALGNRREVLASIVPRLNGHKHLIPGNHDYVWPHRKKVRPADLAMYVDSGFAVHGVSVPFHVGSGQWVLLSHLPYEGDERTGLEDREARYDEYRPPDEGLPLLCGHVHEAWRVRGRMLNVGVDVNELRPVSLDEVLEWMPPSRWDETRAK